MVEKLIRDGQVAVMISPGFGAGWSTWSHDHEEEMLFDREMAQAVIEERWDDVESRAKSFGDYVYTGGIDGLRVEWVPVGQRFRVDEYDGSERLQMTDDRIHTA